MTEWAILVTNCRSSQRTKYGFLRGALVSGVLQGKVNGRHVKQVVSDAKMVLTPGAVNGFQIAQTSCQILVLDIGPIFLDLLGLQVDLAPINLDITAVSGQGNLLGNLLCAIVGLLDPDFLALEGIRDILQSILNVINQLL